MVAMEDTNLTSEMMEAKPLVVVEQAFCTWLTDRLSLIWKKRPDGFIYILIHLFVQKTNPMVSQLVCKIYCRNHCIIN